jgi:hypothetical protein
MGYPAVETQWVSTMCDITEEGAKFIASQFDDYAEDTCFFVEVPYAFTYTVKGIYKKL